MSQQQAQQTEHKAIADEIDGIEMMDARQQTIHTWTVTSWRNNTTTAHEVNLKDLTCTCEDMQYNSQGSEVCDHVMLANHCASRTMDVQAALDHEMRKQMLELKDAVSRMERRASGLEAEQAATDSNSSQDSSDESNDDWDGDPVAQMEALITSKGLDPDQFELWVDDEFGSLQMDIDGFLEDDEFESWKELKQDIGATYDPDNERSYLKPSLFPEVFG